jgi:hypothetical protein
MSNLLLVERRKIKIQKTSHKIQIKTNIQKDKYQNKKESDEHIKFVWNLNP